MKRAEILEAARKCVCGEREREYGRPENNFALIGKLWEAYTGTRYSAKDVAMMLALLKVARIKTGVKGDSFVDLAGYAACAGEIARMRDEYNMRRRLVVRSFNDMGLTCFEPRGAFYAFPCIRSTGMSSQEFCTKLLEEKHVAIIPGDAFGASGEGYCRVSYAYSVEHLTEALKRIREFLQENGLVQGN